MVKSISVGAGHRLLARVQRSLIRPRQFNFLLLRLENQSLLTKRIRSDGLALVQAHLAMRISGVIGHTVRLRIISPGNFVALFPSRSGFSAMMIAEQAQKQMQQPLTIAGQSFSPVLTGVLTQCPAHNRARLTATIAQTSEFLASLPHTSLGKVVSMSGPLPKAELSTPSASAKTELTARFHPQLCCETGSILGFAAIPDSTGAHRSQAAQTAASAGLSRRDWQNLMRQALDALTFWQSEGRNAPTVAISMTSRELGDADLIETLLQACGQRQVSPDRLAIAIRITDCLNPAIVSNVSTLKLAGCRFYLSGFVSNRRSLDYLQELNIRRIGIGAAYTRGCNTDKGRQNLLMGVFAFAEKLGLGIIAEEVETQEESAYLSQLGCDEVQGRAIARPMPMQDSLVFFSGMNNPKARPEGSPTAPKFDIFFSRPPPRSGRLSVRRDQM